MPDDTITPRSLPIERYPGPVCSYTTRDLETGDSDVVVCATNSAFETQFGTVESATPLRTVFDQLEAASDTVGIDTLLERGEPFTVVHPNEHERPVADDGHHEGDDSRYVVQIVPPQNDACGFLLFTETPATEPSTRERTAQTETEPLGVDHVASVISHDLRNPLDVAKARLEAGRELDEDEHFEHVEHAHDRMEQIIQDALTLARGDDAVEPNETVDLEAVATTAWETVETERATLTFAGSLPRVVADADRVGRLFENLFRNAVEHGSRPSGATASNDNESSTANSSITITVGPLEDETVTGFYVADDGSGIPASERTHVLEPGYSSSERGTGLGLAIVARIVDRHGWSIDVTTAATGGARFEISGVDAV